MKITFNEPASKLRFAASDLNAGFDMQSKDFQILTGIQKAIYDQIPEAEDAKPKGIISRMTMKSAPPGPIEIDLEPGQWRIWKDSLLAGAMFRSISIAIAIGLESEG